MKYRKGIKGFVEKDGFVYFWNSIPSLVVVTREKPKCVACGKGFEFEIKNDLSTRIRVYARYRTDVEFTDATLDEAEPLDEYKHLTCGVAEAEAELLESIADPENPVLL